MHEWHIKEISFCKFAGKYYCIFDKLRKYKMPYTIVSRKMDRMNIFFKIVKHFIINVYNAFGSTERTKLSGRLLKMFL